MINQTKISVINLNLLYIFSLLIFVSTISTAQSINDELLESVLLPPQQESSRQSLSNYSKKKLIEDINEAEALIHSTNIPKAAPIVRNLMDKISKDPDEYNRIDKIRITRLHCYVLSNSKSTVEEAEIQAERLLSKCKREFGDNHVETMRIKKLLAWIYTSEGSYKAASSAWREVGQYFFDQSDDKQTIEIADCMLGLGLSELGEDKNIYEAQFQGDPASPIMPQLQFSVIETTYTVKAKQKINDAIDIYKRKIGSGSRQVVFAEKQLQEMLVYLDKRKNTNKMTSFEKIKQNEFNKIYGLKKKEYLRWRLENPPDMVWIIVDDNSHSYHYYDCHWIGDYDYILPVSTTLALKVLGKRPCNSCQPPLPPKPPSYIQYFQLDGQSVDVEYYVIKEIEKIQKGKR